MSLDNADLTYMRDCIDDLMPDTCNILSVTSVSDGMGGFTDKWGTATASVSCRLDTQRGTYRDLDGSIRDYKKLVFSMPQSTSITTANKVEYGDDTYRITAINEGSWLGVRRVEVLKE